MGKLAPALVFLIYIGELTGEKPHRCDICGKAFALFNHLRQQRMTHTGDKPYRYCICGKACSDFGNLNKYMRTHTGEKPYKCDACRKTSHINRLNKDV